ncbi:hypothetical protein D917_09538, partial [Trichinella nativa]
LKFATTVQGIFFDLFDIISDNKTFVGKVFNKIEEKTGRNRCEAATLLASVITVLLLFSKSAELLCNLICFACPAVKIYWLLKCVFFLWLFMPSCSGAAVLHGIIFPPISSQPNNCHLQN